MKEHALEFFLFPMEPNFTTVVIIVFTFDAKRRANHNHLVAVLQTKPVARAT